MITEFYEVSGSKVTLLITDVSEGVRLKAFSTTAEYYGENYDSDSDGRNDSVLATFQAPSSQFGIAYGIFIEDPNGSDTLIAAVDDFTSVTGPVRHSGNQFDVPYIYLGAEARDRVNAGGYDTVYGNGGDDILRAGSGTVLDGGAGDDRLLGSIGRDTLIGGAGRDVLIGGGGADRFVFDPAALDARDVVTDFSRAQHDKVDLSAFAPDLHLVTRFDGGGDAEVRVGHAGANTALVFDLNGDGAADARIVFQGDIAFARTDLILPTV